MIFLKSSRNKTKRGFTLVEVMTIIVIMTILTRVVLVNINEAKRKGRDAARLHDITEIAQALDLFVLGGGNVTTLPTIIPEYVSSLDGATWDSFMQTLGLTSRLDPSNNKPFDNATVTWGEPGSLVRSRHAYTFIKIKWVGGGSPPVGTPLLAPLICTQLERKPQSNTPICADDTPSNPFLDSKATFPLGCVESAANIPNFGSNIWVCIKTGYYK